MSAPRTSPAGAAPGSRGSLAFHRAQLVRQREALSSVWLWYLAPFLPGMLVLSAAYAQRDGHLGNLVIYLAFVSVLFVGVWQLNLLGARRFQKDIEELDALASE